MSQKRRLREETDEHKTANKLQKIETAVESKSKSKSKFPPLLGSDHLCYDSETGAIYLEIICDTQNQLLVPCQVKASDVLYVVETNLNLQFALVDRFNVTFFSSDDVVNNYEIADDPLSQPRVFLHRLDLQIIEAPDDHTVFLDLDDAFDGYALAFYCERTSKITILIANNETQIVQSQVLDINDAQRPSAFCIQDGVLSLSLINKQTYRREHLIMDVAEFAAGVIFRQQEQFELKVAYCHDG